jgi:hypothetical protein
MPVLFAIRSQSLCPEPNTAQGEHSPRFISLPMAAYGTPSDLGSCFAGFYRS